MRRTCVLRRIWAACERPSYVLPAVPSDDVSPFSSLWRRTAPGQAKQ